MNNKWSAAQELDRNCFGDSNTSLTDSFMASPATEADKAVLYAGERAFSVHLIKVNRWTSISNPSLADKFKAVLYVGVRAFSSSLITVNR